MTNMNEVKQSRLDFIDIAKGIGIICVAGGHLVGEGGISFEEIGRASCRERVS